MNSQMGGSWSPKGKGIRCTYISCVYYIAYDIYSVCTYTYTLLGSFGAFWYFALIMYILKEHECICVHLGPHVSRCVWKSEDSLELFLSFHPMSSGNWIQIVRLGGKCPLNHLTRSTIFFNVLLCMSLCGYICKYSLKYKWKLRN